LLAAQSQMEASEPERQGNAAQASERSVAKGIDREGHPGRDQIAGRFPVGCRWRHFADRMGGPVLSGDAAGGPAAMGQDAAPVAGMASEPAERGLSDVNREAQRGGKSREFTE